MSADIQIYTKPGCPYCVWATQLLDRKGFAYQEYDVGDDPVKRADLVKMSNGKQTVPQIFIKGQHVGGCDDLFALDGVDQLDKLLGIEL